MRKTSRNTRIVVFVLVAAALGTSSCTLGLPGSPATEPPPPTQNVVALDTAGPEPDTPTPVVEELPPTEAVSAHVLGPEPTMAPLETPTPLPTATPEVIWPGVTPKPDEALQLIEMINVQRVAAVMPPFAVNDLLMQAAEMHSEYQAFTQTVTHKGDGGSGALDRVLAIGYPSTWVGENVYTGVGGPQEAIDWWLASTDGHRQNLFHPEFREIGVGAAKGANGLTYYTIDISARRDVLPFFINDGAETTASPDVRLTLTNENYFQRTAENVGYVLTVMVSNSPDFTGAEPRTWTLYVPWTLDTSGGPGLKTVYVRFFDVAGYSVDSEASIMYAP